jgi:hypothetical protein
MRERPTLPRTRGNTPSLEGLLLPFRKHTMCYKGAGRASGVEKH